MRIPLVDLAAQHRQIAQEVTDGMARVIERSAFILGEEVGQFERRLAEFCGVRAAVGVGNGTDALEFALRAAGIGPGDEVIVPANSFIASALAVVRAGATPALVDCDPNHYLIDVERASDRAGPRTKAIMPVHLYGQVAPMDAVMAFAREAGITVIEDAAQAQGAKQEGRSAGSFGLAAGTSFYPGKNIGAYGDAGAVLTDSPEIAVKVRRMRNWGSEAKYEHPEIGFNSRLDTLQAVVLISKLRRLAEWNEARREAASRYDGMLVDLEEVTSPATLPGNEHIWHLYVVRVPERDEVLGKLNEAGIGAGIHYPVPIHLHGAMSFLGHKPGDFPVAERAAKEILSLPLYPEITPKQQQQVVDELTKAVR